jgi:glycosyltransferase involved in cell wall biosynthesis
MPEVSVIVCSHNPRRTYLQRVLDGLRDQSLPAPQWELLLIDNKSSGPLSSSFDISWHSNARHVREDELGLTAARLRGIRESRAEILIFVDDDTILDSDYLKQALIVGEQWPFIGAWGGSSIPEYETSLPTWVGSECWRLTVFDVKADIWSNLRDSFATIPVGAGMCVRRTVADQYARRCQDQPKAAILDRSGGGLAGYGDVDLAHCALDLGLGTARTVRLRLTHLIPESRLTLEYFVRHAEDDAASLMLFRASRGLSIEQPKPFSMLGRMRWYIHHLRTGSPREILEIQKAHLRGAEYGYKLAREYLRRQQSSDKAPTP